MAHPLGVAAGQVVVHGDQVGAPTGQGVEVERKGRHQGLAFTGGHLGDSPLMQDDPTDKLNIVGHHVPRQFMARHHHLGTDQASARLAHGRKGLREEVVQRRGQLLLVADLEVMEAAPPAGPAPPGSAQSCRAWRTCSSSCLSAGRVARRSGPERSAVWAFSCSSV